MKLRIRSVSVFLLVLWSASGTLAQTARTIRVVLPQNASTEVHNIASVLARQIAQRCDARVITDAEAPFSVELEVAPGSGTDGFRIENRPGGHACLSANPTGLTRIYHAQTAEPAVKPPQVDPTDPPVTVRSAGYDGPAWADAYQQVVLSSKPIANPKPKTSSARKGNDLPLRVDSNTTH